VTVSLIAAITTDGVVGSNGAMPWTLPSDLKLFRDLTSGHSVVMGRRTWQSIGRALPNRLNVVLSRDPKFDAVGGVVASNIQDALSISSAYSEKTFVIGGTNPWLEALPYAECAHITLIHRHVAGDTWFPAVDWNDWKEVNCLTSTHEVNGAPTRIDFLTYLRPSSSTNHENGR